MNQFLENKKILSYCPNYYKIINEEFDEDDIVTGKLIQIYSEFVFSVNINKKEDLEILEKINEAIGKYFSSDDFKKELTKSIVEMKVKKDIDNVLSYIVKCINKAYEKYLESYTRNIYIPRWI